MTSRWLRFGFLLVTGANFVLAQQYRVALPGYHYQFPKDHFNHPDFQTEWWYYTGNLRTAQGRPFGFELTFFRQGVDRETSQAGAWDLRDLYFAHLALSDLDGGKFLHAERSNRAGPGIAGASEAERAIWNGNWRSTWQGDQQTLEAITGQFELHLTLRSEKPPVIHGQNGVSQKAEGTGRASHYISLTRLATSGEIKFDGMSLAVSGSSWMDHEFFTHQLGPEQAGWDWMSVQLPDNSELMLFNIRRQDGSLDAYSSGTYVDASGRSTHLAKSDFELRPDNSDSWRSPQTSAVYPMRWRVSVPRLGLELSSATSLKSQELSSANQVVRAYWEGAIQLDGNKNGAPTSGIGYLEMTGYDHPVTALR